MHGVVPAIAAAVSAVLLIAVPAAAHDCKCRAFGKIYNQGQEACIRGKLARCEMNLNNSSWKIIGETCPEAKLPVSRPLARLMTALVLPATPANPPDWSDQPQPPPPRT